MGWFAVFKLKTEILKILISFYFLVLFRKLGKLRFCHAQIIAITVLFQSELLLEIKMLARFCVILKILFSHFYRYYQLTISQLLFDKRTTLLEICRVIKTNQFYCRFWMEQLELYPTNNHFTISILLDFWVSELGLDPFCRYRWADSNFHK